MDHLYQTTMLLPASYAVISEEEMTYLDGGKEILLGNVFLVIEGVTGHAVPEKLQSWLTLAAFALLFGLMLFATYNDIIRLLTGAM